MDIGKHLTEYQAIDIRALREGIAGQGENFWAADRVTRANLAGARPGDAVYFYNDQPKFLQRPVLADVRSTGRIDVLRNVARPLFAEIDAVVTTRIQPFYPDCDVIRVQLAELAPGEVIAPHSDHDILRYIHRLHVPIATNDAVQFRIGGEDYRLKQGVLYELNNALTHSVRNEGAQPRIHLLVDMLPHTLGRCRYFDDEKEMAASVMREQLQKTRTIES